MYRYLRPDFLLPALAVPEPDMRSPFVHIDFDEIWHEPSGEPVASMEEVKLNDRIWFIEHPKERSFLRWITQPEIDNFRLQGKICTEEVVVRVTQIEPGIRRRESAARMPAGSRRRHRELRQSERRRLTQAIQEDIHLN